VRKITRNVRLRARTVKGEKSKNDPSRAAIDPMRSHRGNAQDGVLWRQILATGRRGHWSVAILACAYCPDPLAQLI
jgi:hypothetical protein